MIEIKKENRAEIAPLFAGWNESPIWSCLQGCMGSAWADSATDPKSAQIIIADFCFFAGEENEELVRHKQKEEQSDFLIMIPHHERWQKLIEKVYGKDATKVTRYAIKKETDVFERDKLKKIVASLTTDYKLERINEQIFHSTREEKWSSDWCSQFKEYNDYLDRGLGVVVTHNGEIVAGASSYTVYLEGIEIQIDTREDYRRRGLALVCGAKLILECMDRNLYPSWDAQNKGSVRLAEKLGYHFEKEYVAYEVK